jgi:hypothetical protein
MKKLAKSIVEFKENLTKLKDKEPLGILSLIVIIFLDIFVLSVIFTGLGEHTQQLTSPDQYFPYNCREIFIKQNWTSSNEIDRLQGYILYDYSKNLEVKRMHPVCREFYKKLDLIYNNTQVNDFFKQRRKIQKEIESLNLKARKSRVISQNALLSNISKKNNPQNNPSIMTSSKNQSDKFEKLTSELNELDKKIYNEGKVTELFNYVQAFNSQEIQKLEKEVESFKFWYKYKKFGWQMLFLIPLFIFIYFWNQKSIMKDSGLQLLISSHLLVVVSIPIFLKFINLLLELIPQYFFKKVFETLKALHLVAIWHYILILLAVLFAIFLIYIIQKKIFNKKRLQQKRLSNSACFECGKRLPDKLDYCPFCGTKQVEICSECNSKSYVCGDFCSSCGVKKE